MAHNDQPTQPLPAAGKLTIFLGYAPGVGKTTAMLEMARLRQQEGVDVVVVPWIRTATPRPKRCWRAWR